MSKSRWALSKRPSSAEDRPVDPLVLLKEFEEMGTLGVGAYGSVHMAKHSLSKHVVAIKKILVDKSDPVAKLAAEINILRDLDSTHIVRYLGAFFVKPNLNIVMEYCEAGSVADIMRYRQRTMLEPEIATIMQGTLLGLQYMHSKRHVHRDIKGGNVLVTRAGSVKLADFGVAGQLSETTKKRKTVIGTPFWMAPEVIQQTGHDSLADIWSFGILGIEMAEGKPPYADIHPMRAIFTIAQNPAPGLGDGEWGDGLRQVLKKCLVKDVRKRSSASALLKMPFIKGAKPAKETLSTLISEAITLMDARLKKHGSLAPLEEEDEGGDTSAAGTVDGGDATMVVGATMVEASTMVGLDTMVVANDDAESSAAAPDGEQPAFMKRFIEMQAVLAAEAPPDSEGKSASSSDGNSTPTLLTREVDLIDLRRRLEVLVGKGTPSKGSKGGGKFKRRPSST